MSHHYSGPDFGLPSRGRPTRLHGFVRLSQTWRHGKSILIVNVHPSAGENPPGPTMTEPFAPEAVVRAQD